MNEIEIVSSHIDYHDETVHIVGHYHQCTFDGCIIVVPRTLIHPSNPYSWATGCAINNCVIQVVHPSLN